MNTCPPEPFRRPLSIVSLGERLVLSLTVDFPRGDAASHFPHQCVQCRADIRLFVSRIEKRAPGYSALRVDLEAGSARQAPHVEGVAGCIHR